MNGLLVIVFLAAFAAIVWSAHAVLIAGRAGTMARYVYLAVVLVVAVGSYWTTYSYDYFWNENTHVHGWPVPVVIFQRVDADSPWADFVGPTTLLGLPMNSAIFMLIPALMFLAAAWARTHCSTKD